MKPTFPQKWNRFSRTRLPKTGFLGIVLFTLLLSSPEVWAEGSKDLYPNGATGYRSYLMSRRPLEAAHFAPFQSSGTIKVFAQAGEKLYLGSSMQGKTLSGLTGHIVVRKPNGTSGGNSGNSTTVGLISNRDEEKGGPYTTGGTKPANRYQPFVVDVDQTGVWEVDFMSLGNGTNHAINQNNASELATMAADYSWTQAVAAGSSALIAAWDVTVGNASGTPIPGRVFTTLFTGAGPNSRFELPSFYGKFYVLTPDGYAYLVDGNGMNGASFSFFSNNKGPVNNQTDTAPTYKSYSYTTANYTTEVAARIWDPRKTDAGSNVTNKLFFNKPASDLPLSTTWTNGSAVGSTTPTTTWLASEKAYPQVDNLTLTCDGLIGFLPNSNGSYTVEMLVETSTPFTKILTGSAFANTPVQIQWNKLDNSNNMVPAGTVVRIKARLNVGEVHFPFIDSESNLSGIKIQLLDASYSPTESSTVYWDDVDISESNTLANKTNLDGIQSDGAGSNGHKWGGTGSVEAGYFGNNKVLDTWAYVVTEDSEESQQTCMEISGKIWNDGNGNNAKNGAEQNVTGTSGGAGVVLVSAPLYINLIGADGNVVTTTTVDLNGNYSFKKVPANTSGLKIQLSTIQGVVGELPPSTNLPTGWLKVAELTGQENNAIQALNGDGIIELNTQTKAQNSGFDFGIQRPPVANDNSKSGNTVGQPAIIATITANDTDADGSVVPSTISLIAPEGVVVTSTGTDGQGDITSITVQDEGTWTVDVSGNVTFTPVSGFISNPTPIKYTVKDNAGALSNVANLSVIYVSQITISGNVWHDANGNALKDGTEKPVSGENSDGNGGNSSVTSQDVYANLVGSDNNVLASVKVNNTGSYTFDNVAVGASYKVIITTTEHNSGTPLTSATIPNNWLATGVNVSGDEDTGNRSGIINLANVVSNRTGIDFGIQQPPVATDNSVSGITVGSTATIPTIATDDSDPEDGATINPATISLVVPAGLTISGTPATDANGDITSFVVDGDGTWAVDASGNVTFAPASGFTGNPTSIGYTVRDIAGATSNVATLSVTYITSIAISGSIWHDVDGSDTQNNGEIPVSGQPSNNNSGSSSTTSETIYANLVKVPDEVVASTQVNETGTYNFNNVVPGEEYKVILTTEETTTPLTTATLPTGWASTGSGNSITDLGVVTTDQTNIDFGIQQPPVATSANYGLTNKPTSGVIIPLDGSIDALSGSGTKVAQLVGSDPDATVATPFAFVINSLPVTTGGSHNGDAPVLLYNGTPVTDTDITNGTKFSNPSLFSVELNGTGYEGISFGFKTVDAAGAESADATYQLGWSSSLPVTLISFTARAEGNAAVTLSWKTSQESNADRFLVERSADAKEWNQIAEKVAVGESKSLATYNSQDEVPLSGNNYYRLKMVDLDGTFAYSRVINVKLEGASHDLTAYPNPVVNVLYLKDIAFETVRSISLTNMNGRAVFQSNKVTAQGIDITSYINGIYLLKTTFNDGSVTAKKIVINK